MKNFLKLFKKNSVITKYPKRRVHNLSVISCASIQVFVKIYVNCKCRPVTAT